MYALATNEKHTDDVLIGLQDNGTRLRVGKSNTYNQVFGGNGFGVGWSEGWCFIRVSTFGRGVWDYRF